MFKTVKRIIRWCGEFRGKLYIGFVFSLFSTRVAAMPNIVAAYTAVSYKHLTLPPIFSV